MPGEEKLDPGCRNAVIATAKLLAGCGHDVHEAHPSAVFEDEYLANWFMAMSVAAAQRVAAIADTLGRKIKPGELDPVVEYWVESGSKIGGLQLANALAWLAGFRHRVAQWWEEGFDLLLCPVYATPPRPLGWPWAEPGGIEGTIRAVKYCVPFNTTGQPAVSIPAGCDGQGRPLAVQLVGNHRREDLLVSVAAQLEAIGKWTDDRPKLERSHK